MQKSTKLSLEQLNRHTVETYKKLYKSPIILVLDNIRSAINVGSIFRTADAFNVEKIYLCGITATPPNKEILKSALGATESVNWEYAEDTLKLIEILKKLPDHQILSIEQTSISVNLNNFVPEPTITSILIFGNEVDGVNQEIINISNQCIEIPQFGTKHSLNVAVSAGIVLWDIHNKLLSASK